MRRAQYAQQAHLEREPSGRLKVTKPITQKNTGALEFKRKQITDQFNRTAIKWESYKRHLEELSDDIDSAQYKWEQTFPYIFKHYKNRKTNHSNRLEAKQNLANLLQDYYRLDKNPLHHAIEKLRNNVHFGETSMSLEEISNKCAEITSTLDKKILLRKHALDVVRGQRKRLLAHNDLS